jgi:hypothetical protein
MRWDIIARTAAAVLIVILYRLATDRGLPLAILAPIAVLVVGFFPRPASRNSAPFAERAVVVIGFAAATAVFFLIWPS